MKVEGLTERLAAVRLRIERAAERARRDPSEVLLLAVTKIFPAAAIRDAYDLGLRDFGENYVQEFEGKAPEVAALPGARFHLIGHLQSNKAAKATEIFHAVDSIDSAKLAQRLNDAAQKLNMTLDTLIEINVGGEDAKSGLDPDSAEI